MVRLLLTSRSLLTIDSSYRAFPEIISFPFLPGALQVKDISLHISISLELFLQMRYNAIEEAIASYENHIETRTVDRNCLWVGHSKGNASDVWYPFCFGFGEVVSSILTAALAWCRRIAYIPLRTGSKTQIISQIAGF